MLAHLLIIWCIQNSWRQFCRQAKRNAVWRRADRLRRTVFWRVVVVGLCHIRQAHIFGTVDCCIIWLWASCMSCWRVLMTDGQRLFWSFRLRGNNTRRYLMHPAMLMARIACASQLRVCGSALPVHRASPTSRVSLRPSVVFTPNTPAMASLFL